MKQPNTYSRDPRFTGYDHKEIKSLKDELRKANSEILRIEEEIEKIQDDCVHNYLFWSMGAYEDFYICDKCGHETWK
jgi:hypothetical protein